MNTEQRDPSATPNSDTVGVIPHWVPASAKSSSTPATASAPASAPASATASAEQATHQGASLPKAAVESKNSDGHPTLASTSRSTKNGIAQWVPYQGPKPEIPQTYQAGSRNSGSNASNASNTANTNLGAAEKPTKRNRFAKPKGTKPPRSKPTGRGPSRASSANPKPAVKSNERPVLIGTHNANGWTPAPAPSKAKQAARILRRPRVLFVLGALVSVSLVRVLMPSGPSYPKAWDPQVAKLAATTEKLRGLSFKRPVYVKFLTDAEFDRNDSPNTKPSGSTWSTSYDSDNDAVLRCLRDDAVENHPPCTWNNQTSGDDVDPIESVFRALRLAKSEDDVSALPLDLRIPSGSIHPRQSLEGAFAIARYDDVHKVIEVRGKSAAGNEPTIVHELVHVLQDQNFTSKWPDNSDEILAYRALIEGDARSIENDFLDTEKLTPAERAARKRAEDALDSSTDERIGSAVKESKINENIVGLRVRRSGFPYSDGEYFVRELKEKLGQAGLDAAFAKPPLSSAEILYPPTFFNRTLKNPVIPDLLNVQNAYSTKPFRLGAWYTAEALWAAKTSEQAITEVIKSWAGDAMVMYEDESTHRVCFSTAIALHGPLRSKASTTLTAFALYVNGTFKPTSTGGTLTACDPYRIITS
jgi:hypothetical protein